MISLNGKIFLVVLLLASILRIWGAFDVKEYTDDEYVQIPSAISLFQYGTVEELQWVHPPLSSIVLYTTMSVFGNNPVGWRIGNIFFGTLSILIIYLVGKTLYPDSFAPLITAALLAFDPLHVDFSRNTFMEVPTSALFLAFLYFMLQYSERQRKTLIYAGIALGLTISMKAYYLFTIPVVVIFAVYRVHQKQELDSAIVIEFISALLILPLCIYFLTFIHWFGRGYTLADFIQMKIDAVWSVKKITLEYFHAKDEIVASGKPWQWFIKPVLFGFKTFSEGDYAKYLLEINNFPFRILVIPAMLTAGIHAWRKRVAQEMLIPILFVVCYSLFLSVNRPVFGSNAIILLPFAYLMIARTVVLTAEKLKRENEVIGLFLTAVFVWGIYTYPLVTGKLVPVSIYNPIITFTNILPPSKEH